MKKYCNIISVLLFSFSILGCQSSLERYPLEWGPLQKVADNECPNISGNYYDITAGASLFLIFFDDCCEGWEEKTQTEIIMTDNALFTVKVRDKNLVVIREKVFFRNKGYFECNSGMIVFPRFSKMYDDSEKEIIQFGHYKEECYFSKTEGGYLALQKKARKVGIGMAFVPLPLPYYSPRSSWHLFKPVGSDSK